MVLICSLLWGRELCNRGKREELLLSGLCSFVRYTKEQINAFRAPLFRIFDSFSHDELERVGFIRSLRSGEGKDSAKCLRQKIPDSAYKEICSFLENLGGGYEDGQNALCAYTLKRLEEVHEERKANLVQRLKMYRSLPFLLALSLIILFI